MDTFIAFVIAAAVLLFFVRRYLKDMKKARSARTRGCGAWKDSLPRTSTPTPHIDATYCIGCAACTAVCPEGDVLAMFGGKAVIVNGHKCIGHSLCAEVCPVGAITMVMAGPSVGQDMPYLTPEYETTIHNLFIAGELGGLALIKNAIGQGRDCVDTIANRITSLRGINAGPGVYDILIVGAGPAGISASLRAIERKLHHVTLDEGELGGTVAKYPRQKLVMTSPVEFPMYGKFKKTELSKEELIDILEQSLGSRRFQFPKRRKSYRHRERPGRYLHRSYDHRPVSRPRGGSGARPDRQPEKTRGKRRRSSESDVPSDRSRSLREQAHSHCWRRR